MPTLTKPKSCEGCAAYRVGRGFVPPAIVPNPKYLLIGSGPTSDEYLDGQPFTGFAGRRLDSWLTRAGISRADCTLAHVVQCQLPYEKGAPREPTAHEIDHCRGAYWGQVVDGAELVIPLGIGATKALLGRKASSKDIGNLHGDLGHLVLPIQSPTYIAGGNWAEEPAQIEFLKYAKDLADGKPHERPNFDRPPPGVQFKESPGLDDLQAFSDQLGPSGHLVVDIETAGDHIRLVGLYDDAHHSYLGFPIRSIGGGVYWDRLTLPRAIEWLWGILADPAIGKTFHNGASFDIPMLERNGFTVCGYEFDTMLGMHIAYPGVPKGLEELSKVYLRAGGWKAMVRVDDEDVEEK